MEVTTIAGVVTREPELRRTQSGDPVLGFSVAVSQGKDKQGNWRDSKFFDCSLWGKRAEALSPYIKKSGKVTVSGQVSAREHNGKAYLQLRVNELTLQGGGEQRGYDSQAPVPQAGHAPDFNDDIPFAPQVL